MPRTPGGSWSPNASSGSTVPLGAPRTCMVNVRAPRASRALDGAPRGGLEEVRCHTGEEVQRVAVTHDGVVAGIGAHGEPSSARDRVHDGRLEAEIVVHRKSRLHEPRHVGRFELPAPRALLEDAETGVDPHAERGQHREAPDRPAAATIAAARDQRVEGDDTGDDEERDEVAEVAVRDVAEQEHRHAAHRRADRDDAERGGCTAPREHARPRRLRARRARAWWPARSRRARCC